VLNDFYKRTEVRKLAAENGLDGKNTNTYWLVSREFRLFTNIKIRRTVRLKKALWSIQVVRIRIKNGYRSIKRSIVSRLTLWESHLRATNTLSVRYARSTLGHMVFTDCTLWWLPNYAIFLPSGAQISSLFLPFLGAWFSLLSLFQVGISVIPYSGVFMQKNIN